MTSEPCTRPVGRESTIGGSCPICGHTNLVHPGDHNPDLSECAICTILAAATRLEMRTPFKALIPMSDEEFKEKMSWLKHEPVDHTGGREKPSPTVRWLRCMICDVRLVPDATETYWVHEVTPQKASREEVREKMALIKTDPGPILTFPKRETSLGSGFFTAGQHPGYTINGPHYTAHIAIQEADDVDYHAQSFTTPTEPEQCPAKYDWRRCELPDTHKAHTGGHHQAPGEPFRWRTGTSDRDRWRDQTCR